MTMTFPAATARLGRELATAHEAIDAAMVATSAVLHSATIARADLADLDAGLGHEALLKMHRGLGQLLTVRADFIRAHASLSRDAQVVAGPDEPTCPKNPLTSGSLNGEDSAIAA